MMGILILFVLIVGTVTIANFAWKGAVRFWLKVDANEIVSKKQTYVPDCNRTKNDDYLRPKYSGKIMSLSDWSVGRWW
jgi:hypothetical protein